MNRLLPWYMTVGSLRGTVWIGVANSLYLSLVVAGPVATVLTLLRVL